MIKAEKTEIEYTGELITVLSEMGMIVKSMVEVLVEQCGIDKDTALTYIMRTAAIGALLATDGTFDDSDTTAYMLDKCISKVRAAEAEHKSTTLN